MADMNSDMMRVLAARGGATPNAAAGGRARAKSIMSRAASQVAGNMTQGGANARVVGKAVQDAQTSTNAQGQMAMAKAETAGEGQILSAAQQTAAVQEQKIQHESQMELYSTMDVFDVAARVGQAAEGIFSMTRYLGQKFGNKDYQRASAELTKGPGGIPSVAEMEQGVLHETQQSITLVDEQMAKYGEQVTGLTTSLAEDQKKLEGLAGDDLTSAQIGIDLKQSQLAAMEGQIKILEADKANMLEFTQGLAQRQDERLQASQEGGNLFDHLANPFGIVDAISVTTWGSAYDAQRLSEQQRGYLASQTAMTQLMDSLEPDRVVAEIVNDMTRRFTESTANMAAQFPEVQGEIRDVLIKYGEFMESIGNRPRVDFGDFNRGLEWIDTYLWPNPNDRPSMSTPSDGVIPRR